MKFRQLQIRLVKVGIICLVLLAVGLIAMLIVGGINDKAEEEVAAIKSKTIAAGTSFRIMDTDVKDSKDALAFYDTFSASENADPQNFRREFAKNLLSRLKEEMMLPDLKFTMTQFEKQGDEFERQYVALFGSKVTIKYSANSDVEAFNIIRAVGQLFPGSVTILSYRITRVKEINNQLLASVGDGKDLSGTVNGEIVFEWDSIQDNPDYKGKRNPNAVTPASSAPPEPKIPSTAPPAVETPASAAPDATTQPAPAVPASAPTGPASPTTTPTVPVPAQGGTNG